MDRRTAYTALLTAAWRNDEEEIRRWLRSVQAFGLPASHREHFILGYAMGRLT
jgi:hypothetical protein